MCQTLQKVTARFHYEVQQVLQSVTVNTEAYLEPCKTSMMKYFEKIFNDLNPFTIFIKSVILVDWQGSKYVTAILALLCLETLSYIICCRNISSKILIQWKLLAKLSITEDLWQKIIFFVRRESFYTCNFLSRKCFFMFWTLPTWNEPKLLPITSIWESWTQEKR